MKTTIAREEDITRVWYVVDAADQPVGRLAVKIANLLRGRNKRDYTPHVDMGDFVVVVNAGRVGLTGGKEEKKIYKRYSGYPGGLKLETAGEVRKRNPTRIVTQAVHGMLPRNKLSRRMFRRLRVYAGPEHPHAAQQPKTVKA